METIETETQTEKEMETIEPETRQTQRHGTETETKRQRRFTLRGICRGGSERSQSAGSFGAMSVHSVLVQKLVCGHEDRFRSWKGNEWVAGRCVLPLPSPPYMSLSSFSPCLSVSVSLRLCLIVSVSLFSLSICLSSLSPLSLFEYLT
jgi:hypothetical protein